MSGKTPAPTGKQNAETMSYKVPAKPAVGHKHGKPTGAAQGPASDIGVGYPHSSQPGELATSRAEAQKAGLPDGHKNDRNQEAQINAGNPPAHKGAGPEKQVPDNSKSKHEVIAAKKK